MIYPIFFGLVLGWGAAIPIGPINLEIIRRNLFLGTVYGMALGIGACTADLTYLVLLSLSTLAIFTHPLILKIIGILGALILAWFGYSALRIDVKKITAINTKPRPAWSHALEGYFLTLLNPPTILFWASVSAQVAIFSHKTSHSILYAGTGVFLGTLSWIIALNTILFLTRHRLSPRAIQLLNYAGGIILIGFAFSGLWHAV